MFNGSRGRVLFRRHLDCPQSTTQLKVRVLNVDGREKMMLI